MAKDNLNWAALQAQKQVQSPAQYVEKLTQHLLSLNTVALKTAPDSFWKEVDLEIGAMVDLYEQILRQQGSPLTQKMRGTMKQIIDLLNARIKTMLLPEALKKKPLFSLRPPVVLEFTPKTVLRRLRVLARLLTIHYITYQLPPTGFWYTLHAHFESALRLGFLTIDEAGCIEENSILSAYLQLVTFPLCNPLGFKKSQYSLVIQMIAKFANSSRLFTRAPAQDNVHGLYLINYTEDKEPLPSTRNHAPIGEHCFFLQVHDFAYQLKQYMLLIEREQQPMLDDTPISRLIAKELSPREQKLFLTQMLKDITNTPVRGRPRMKVAGQLDFCKNYFGLWSFYSEGQKPDAIYQAMTIDRHVQGLAFCIAGDDELQLSVGSLISYNQLDNESGNWYLAAIRWIEYDSLNNQCYCGCEILSYSVTAWLGRLVFSNEQGDDANATSAEIPVLMSVMPPGIGESSVFLPRDQLQDIVLVDKVLRLESTAVTQEILISEVIEICDGIMRFRYVAL
jgi:hypothetical protein